MGAPLAEKPNAVAAREIRLKWRVAADGTTRLVDDPDPGMHCCREAGALHAHGEVDVFSVKEQILPHPSHGVPSGSRDQDMRAGHEHRRLNPVPYTRTLSHTIVDYFQSYKVD